MARFQTILTAPIELSKQLTTNVKSLPESVRHALCVLFSFGNFFWTFAIGAILASTVVTVLSHECPVIAWSHSSHVGL